MLQAARAAEPIAGALFVTVWIAWSAGRLSFGVGSRGYTLAFVAAVLLVGVAIAFARFLPALSLVAATGLVVGQLLFPVARFESTFTPIYSGLALWVLVASAYADKRMRRATAIAVVGDAIGIAALNSVPGLVYGPPGSETPVVEVLGNFSIALALSIGIASAAWVVGAIARTFISSRRKQQAALERAAEELKQAESELLRSDERDRIAQDVHDIMAHSLTVIIAQADGARSMAGQEPTIVGDSLARIADSARASLTEVRMLIESLAPDPEGHSHPGLGDLGGLIAQMRRAGLHVEVSETGDRSSLTATQELAVYRICQESLTNALRHGREGGRVHLRMAWTQDAMDLEVVSEIADGSSRSNPPSSGRGLVGMDERARLAGGRLSITSDRDSYRVLAHFPTLDAA